jgi:lambda family phage tail tape measure protein
MADLSYRVDIDTRNAQRSLDSLKKTIGQFGSLIAGGFTVREISTLAGRFQDLRTTLQLLYKDAQLGSAAFDDIKKFAETSIFSVDNLTETIVKLKAAGLEPTIDQLRLFADVSSVAADSVGALQAITDLYARTTAGGLGLEDLNRLADRGIPVFTILSERLGLSRLEISKIGQTAEGAAVILKALEDGLQETFGGASASRAGNVNQAISNFGDAVANAADAIGQAGFNDLLAGLFRGFSKIVETVGLLLVPITKLLTFIIQLATSFKPLNDAVLMFVGILTAAFFAGVVKGFLGVIAVTRTATVAFAALSAVISKGPLRLFALGASVAAGAVALFSDQLKKLGIISDDVGESEGFKVLQNAELGAGVENLKDQVSALNQELNSFKAEMSGVAENFARFNKQAVDSINLETSLIGKTQEEIRVRQAQAEIARNAADEIARLVTIKAKLNDEEKRQGRGEIIDQTIAKIKEQAEIDKKTAESAIKLAEERQRIRQLELFSIKTQISLFEDLEAIQGDIAKMTMSEIEKKYYDIDVAARRAARSAIQAEEARIGRPLNAEEQRRYYEEAAKGVDRLRQKTKEHYDQSRTWSTGWVKAFKEYREAAGDAASRAASLFKKATQGMEDAIVNFAKTGKFEWKSFVADLAEELLRGQIRQLIAKTLGPIADFMGLDLGSVAGGAPGGSPNNPMYVMPVNGGMSFGVGGGGGGAAPQAGGGGIGSVFAGVKNVAGQVWDTVKNVGSSIGNVFGGVIDTVKNVGSGIWNAVSNIGSSVMDFFGGFFANGGTLGAGKWGIVGERGPEIISGPANITPMTGLGTNVTYNINAVDAASFKALVARDPAFIHAVAMQGGMAIPSRR